MLSINFIYTLVMLYFTACHVMSATRGHLLKRLNVVLSVFPWAVPQTEHTLDALRAEDGKLTIHSSYGKYLIYKQNCVNFKQRTKPT